jgi:hypothetical protein
LICSYISLIAASEKPCLAILAIFKARRILDCSRCTQPPCLGIVADILKTYKTLVLASKSEIRQLAQSHMTWIPPLQSLMPVPSTPGDVYNESCPWKSENVQDHHVQCHGECGEIPWSTWEVSHCWLRKFVL